jgi:hypothetical protein
MIGNRLLTAMLLCGAFMEDEPPRRPPSKASPDPEPLDPIDALKHIDARMSASGGEATDPETPFTIRAGNSVGKTDLRGMLERMKAQGLMDDIPARAAEVDKAVRPAPWGPTYAPFYTPAELEERRAQAKAKKAKRKGAQASKRRNRA